jgi:chromosome segregation ATPase
MSEAQQETPRMAGTIVTSENLAEFNAQRIGLADPEPSEAAEEAEPQEIEEQSEPVEAESEAAPTEERKQNPKLEKRFSEITKQREAARAEAKAEREARESLEQRLREVEGRLQPQAEEKSETEPQPEQFTDMYEYAKALTDYRVDVRLKEEKQKEVNAKVAAEREKVINTWADRVQTAKKEIPDFEDMVGSADVVVSNEVRDAIFESEVGPRILYHLAENPEIGQKLQGMTLTAALKAIGKLEAKFETTEPISKTVGKSKAPAPINPIRSAANGRDVNLTANGEFHGSYQAWKAARLAGRIR